MMCRKDEMLRVRKSVHHIFFPHLYIWILMTLEEGQKFHYLPFTDMLSFGRSVVHSKYLDTQASPTIVARCK